jgi:hypothetical protein
VAAYLIEYQQRLFTLLPTTLSNLQHTRKWVFIPSLEIGQNSRWMISGCLMPRIVLALGAAQLLSL